MNEYYKVLDTLKSVVEADAINNTVTQGNIDSVDLNKKNIYPLTNIIVTTGAIKPRTIDFSVTIHCVDIRDDVRKANKDKFTGVDNEIDNLNTTLAILNRVYKRLVTYDDSIEVSAEANIESIMGEFTNTLDGWQMDFTLTIDNINVDAC